MTVEVVLPGVLADLAEGRRALEVQLSDSCLRDLLDLLAAAHPLLGRRLRDETGALRRFVNVYVDGDDVRWSGELATPIPDGAVVQNTGAGIAAWCGASPHWRGWQSPGAVRVVLTINSDPFIETAIRQAMAEPLSSIRQPQLWLGERR